MTSNNVPATKVKNQGFHHSICGCFSDCSQCCDTYWWPCCQMGRQCAAADGQPHACGCGMCCIAFCFPEFFPMCIRCKVSDRYQLGENCCTSCICGIFCYECSLCQTGRELNFRGVNPGGCCCVAPDYIDPEAEPPGPTVIQVNVGQGYNQQQQQPPNQPGGGSPQYYQSQPNQTSSPTYGGAGSAYPSSSSYPAPQQPASNPEYQQQQPHGNIYGGGPSYPPQQPPML